MMDAQVRGQEIGRVRENFDEACNGLEYLDHSIDDQELWKHSKELAQVFALLPMCI